MTATAAFASRDPMTTSSAADRHLAPDPIETARLGLLFEHMTAGIVASGVFSALVIVLLQQLSPSPWLMVWLVVRLAWLLPRLAQVRWHRQRGVRSERARRRRYRLKWAMMAVDGALWGVLAWGLTPVDRMDVAALTLSSLMGVAAVGTFMMALDWRMVAAFVVPMILPNAIMVAATRQDQIGWFACLSLIGFQAVTLLGSLQSQRRVYELLRLRFASERLAAERAQALELARLNADARSRFLATVSHEMRTPLHGILGLTRLLLQEQPRPDQRQRLALVEKSGDHLLTVINDILDFSRIEAGGLQIEARTFDLDALLQEAAGVFQVLAQRKGLTLSLHTDWEGRCEITSDPSRLRQVLHNLLGNAVKFTEQGSVHLMARRLDGGRRFELTVRDTGAGIAAGDVERIFDAFTQVHGGDDRPQGGTGLGLSIARHLCRALGGDLTCESTPGVGSTFRATFSTPNTRVSPPGDRGDTPSVDFGDTVPAPETQWWTVSGARVLLVEDNPVNIVVAEAVLRNLGCEVHTVTDGAQAIAWLDTESCDVVLMDCTMPVLDGFEASRLIRAREIREGRSRVPIIALTANALADVRTQCLNAGMDAHIAKPFTPEDVQRAMLRVLGHAALLRSQ